MLDFFSTDVVGTFRDLGIPPFWVYYLLAFWTLAGITTSPITFRSKRYSAILGGVLGAPFGFAVGLLFLVCFGYWPDVSDFVWTSVGKPITPDIIPPLPFLGLLLGLGICGAIAYSVLVGAWMLIPARKAANPGFTADRPNLPTDYSIRVDKVSVGWQVTHVFRATVALALAFIVLIPVMWMGMTAFKSQSDAVASPPKLTFTPTLEGFVSQFWDHRDVKGEELAELQANRDDLKWQDRIMLDRQMKTTRTSDFAMHLRNSLIIASTSTLLSVGFGLLSAYAFSRFNVPGEDDLLFFILSTRMLPPVVVTIPIFLMYRQVGLYDTHVGMIILYTAFNLSLSVWLLKGFIDEIPREYEEAALVDGYTRLQAFVRVVLPQAMTGIATTIVFCFIFAWNEYAFAIMLTSGDARTAPPSLPAKIGVGTTEWAAIAFGSLVFLVPVVIVTFTLRQHLLRGVTFGAIRRG